jgi:hypothetical protein
MKVGVHYYAKYLLGDYCVIKKTAYLSNFLEVKARLQDGNHIERRYEFFTLGGEVET